MTKVNLLPDYIWEGKRIKQTAMLVTLGVVAELAIIGFIYAQTNSKLADLTAEMNTAQTEAAKVDDINTKADGITAKILPTTQKTDYIASILKHDQKFPNLFERTGMYTTPKVSYRQLQPAMNVLNMTANARSVGDIGRYLLNIQRAKDMFSAVSVTSQMPGWPTATDSSGSGSSAPAANPYTPGGYPGSAASPYGAYRPSTPGGFTPPEPGDTVASAGPALLDFTAVGQLTEKFKMDPPIYAGNTGASAEGGTGASPYGAAYPGAPGTGGYPGSQYRPTGGSNGG